MSKNVRIASACKDGGCCPVVDYDSESGLVTIHDPEAPIRGSFVLTKDEWDLIVKTTQK